MKKEVNRSPNYTKRKVLETMLEAINDRLSKDEKELISQFDQPNFPTLFIIGLQRSGTTLLMQLLLQYANFGYINNLIARFWQAPYLGTIFARSFFATTNRTSQINLQSDLGYTQGYDGPHEFSYFWRNWFPEATFEGKPNPNKAPLLKTIAALESEWKAPILFKNIVTCSMVINQLAEIFPKSVFLYIERDSYFTAQSTYLSRLKLFDDPMAWFGLKPPEYSQIAALDSPWEQISGQLFYCKEFIEKSLSKLPDSRKTFIKYEELIYNPNRILKNIYETVAKSGFNLELKSDNLKKLHHTNQVKLNVEDEKQLRAALKKYKL